MIRVEFTDGWYTFWSVYSPSIADELIFRVPDGKTPMDRVVDGMICEKRVDIDTFRIMEDDGPVMAWMAVHGSHFLKDGHPVDPDWWPPQFIWNETYDDLPSLVVELMGELYNILYRLTVNKFAAPHPYSSDASAAQR